MLNLKDLVSQVQSKVTGAEEQGVAPPSGDDSPIPVTPAPVPSEPAADVPPVPPAPDVQAIVNAAVAAAIAPLQAQIEAQAQQIAALEASRAKDEAIARATLNVHARDIVSGAAKEHIGPKLDQVLTILGQEQQRDQAEERRQAVVERVEPLLTALYNLGVDDVKSIVEEMQGLVREAKRATATANAHAADAVNAVNALSPYLARILKEEIPLVARKGATDEEF